MNHLLKTSAIMSAALACLVLSSGTTSAGSIPVIEQKIFYGCSAGGPGTATEICAINPDGTGFANLTNNGQGDSGPELSPDGRYIAWRHDITELWVMDSDGANGRKVTDVNSAFGEPTWSPNGRQLASFCSNPDQLTVEGFCIIDVATGEVQFGYDIEFYTVEDLSWSPDGTKILFSGEQISGGSDLYVLDLELGTAQNITNTPGDNEYGTWSPLGDKIAFVGHPTDDDGDDDPFPNLYRMNPNGTDRQLLNDPRGLSPSHSNPAYSPDGELLVWFCTDAAPADPPEESVCINNATFGQYADRFADGDNGLVTGSNPDWGYTAGPLFGDLDCDGDVDEDDMLLLLEVVNDVETSQPCVPLTDNVEVAGVARPFGDLNCDGLFDAIDALPILLALAGLPEAFEDCPTVGAVANVIRV